MAFFDAYSSDDSYGFVCVDGQIGGGKTLLCVEEILRRHFSSGRHVYTNIELLEDGIDKWFRRNGLSVNWRALYHRVDAASDWSQCVEDSVLIIDEFSEFFDTADRDSRSGKELHFGFVRFIRQSRKMRIKVYLIGQVFDSLNPALRKLVTTRYYSMDVARIKLGFFPLGRLPVLRDFYVRFAYDKPFKKPNGWPKWVVKDPLVWTCYNTRQVIGDALCSQDHLEREKVEKKPFNPIPVMLSVLCLNLVLTAWSLFRSPPAVVAAPAASFYEPTRESSFSVPSAVSAGVVTQTVNLASVRWQQRYYDWSEVGTDFGNLSVGKIVLGGRVAAVGESCCWVTSYQGSTNIWYCISPEFGMVKDGGSAGEYSADSITLVPVIEQKNIDGVGGPRPVADTSP